MPQPQQTLPLHLDDQPAPAVSLDGLFDDVPAPSPPGATANGSLDGLFEDLLATPTSTPAAQEPVEPAPADAPSTSAGRTRRRRYRRPKPVDPALVRPLAPATPPLPSAPASDLTQLAAAVSELIGGAVVAGADEPPARGLVVTDSVLNQLAAERARAMPRPTSSQLVERCVTSYIVEHVRSGGSVTDDSRRVTRGTASRRLNIIAPTGWWTAVNAFCAVMGFTQTELVCRAVTAHRLRDTRPPTPAGRQS